MAESGGDRPLYGQFGQAVFDEDVISWSFERDVNTEAVFQPLGEARGLVPAALEDISHDSHINGTSGRSRRIEKQTKALIQRYPELQPSSKILPDQARISEVVETAAAHHEPTQGELLAFGMIYDEDGTESAEILAFPTGPTGGNVRVVQVQRQRRNLDGSENDWIEVPVIRGLEATWIGPGAPVRSIVFARPSQHGDVFFAVRLPAQTWIFRPVICVTQHGSLSLTLHAVFHLNIDDTGGTTLADISFHPLNPRKFAIIDQSGHWSVRELGGDAFNSAEEVARGDLVDQPEESSRSINDGWARIACIGAHPIFAICNRQQMVLHDVQDDAYRQLQNAPTVLDGGSGWNLDIVVLGSAGRYLAVLTTNHILIYYVNPDAFEGLSDKCTNCIRHFRDPDDISMRMHVFPDGEDILLFLRSDISPIIVSYRFHFSSPFGVAVSDPTEFTINSLSNERSSATRMSSLHLFRLQSSMQSSTHFLGSSAVHHAPRESRYYSIISLRKDLSVSEMLCSLGPHKRLARTRVSNLAEQSGIQPLEKVGAEEDPVERGDKQVLTNTKIRAEPVSAFVRGFSDQDSKRSTQNWTTTYEMTCERLNNIESIEFTDMNEALGQARRLLQFGGMDGRLPIGTLRELINGEVTLQNSRNGIAELQDFQQTARVHESGPPGPDVAEQSERLVLRQIDWPLATLTPVDAANRLRNLYDSIVANWVDTLPRQIRNLSNARQEHLARQMATEVTLASLLLRPKESKENAPGQVQHTSQQFEIPVRHPAAPSHSRAASSVYFDASSQPRSPAAHSTATSLSHASMTEATEFTSLSKYTTFSKPAPPILARSLRKVLSHWQTGADPSDYDWQATSRRFAREEQTDGGEMTEKERERLQRRAERYMQRQRREAEESQRLQLLSSQAPELVVTSESQPTQRRDPYGVRGADSSQQAASQVLRGRHGGRKPPKKKQKRKSGF